LRQPRVKHPVKVLRNDAGQQICMQCGMPIETYDENPRWAQYEEKWSIHYDCYLQTLNLLDRESHITSERQSMHRR